MAARAALGRAAGVAALGTQSAAAGAPLVAREVLQAQYQDIIAYAQAAGWIVYAGVAEGHCLLYEVDRRAQENFVGEVLLAYDTEPLWGVTGPKLGGKSSSKAAKEMDVGRNRTNYKERCFKELIQSDRVADRDTHNRQAGGYHTWKPMGAFCGKLGGKDGDDARTGANAGTLCHREAEGESVVGNSTHFYMLLGYPCAQGKLNVRDPNLTDFELGSGVITSVLEVKGSWGDVVPALQLGIEAPLDLFMSIYASGHIAGDHVPHGLETGVYDRHAGVFKRRNLGAGTRDPDQWGEAHLVRLRTSVVRENQRDALKDSADMAQEGLDFGEFGPPDGPAALAARAEIDRRYAMEGGPGVKDRYKRQRTR